MNLIPLRIASQNLTPDNPNLDARPLFQAALDYAKKNKIHLITADQGSYYFLTTRGKRSLPVHQYRFRPHHRSAGFQYLREAKLSDVASGNRLQSLHTHQFHPR